MPGGRPSKYSIALADKICELLAFGKSLLKICDMKGMPTYRSVMRWLIKHEEFCHKYEVARKVQRERWADEIIDIPDDSRGDVVVAIGTGGAAPALAAELKKQIDLILPDQIGEFTRALAEMRKQLHTEVADIQQRSEIMKKLSNHASYEAFCRNGESALAKICRESISQGLP